MRCLWIVFVGLWLCGGGAGQGVALAYPGNNGGFGKVHVRHAVGPGKALSGEAGPDAGIRLAQGIEGSEQEPPGGHENLDLDKLEKEFKKLLDETRRAGRKAREKIARDVIPRLKRELEKLRRKLERDGREEKGQSEGGNPQGARKI